MVRSLAALVFIGVTAAAGLYVGTRPTVLRGDAMAARMLDELRDKGITQIACDDHIPVSPAGALFRCKYHGDDGSTARFEFTMDRAGQLSRRVLDTTGPTRERPPLPPGTDIWGN